MRNLLIIILVVFLVSCDVSICDNQLIEDVKSSNGEFTASIFERNCGATTPFVKVVSLRSTMAKLDLDNDDDWVFTIHGQSDVKVSWILDNKLKVSYTSTGDKPVQRENVEWDNYHIRITLRMYV